MPDSPKNSPTETARLLGQLKIDRTPEPPPRRAPRPWIWIAAPVGLILAAASVVVFLRPDPPRVSVAVARAASASAGAADAPGSTQLDASGYVVARRQATVSSKITGKVTDVLIEEGQRVEQGAVVGKLDDTNVRASLDQAQAQFEYSRASLAQVRVNLLNAERDFKRKQSLFEGHFVSQSDLDNASTTQDALSAQLVTAQRSVDVAAKGLESARRNLDDTVIRAPFTGVVTVKAAQPGEMVSPISAGGGFTRTGIGTIVDMDSLEVEVDVNENFIARVHSNQPATIKLNAYPDWEIPAYVIAIIPTADRSKATVKVRVGFRQKDVRVLPEMGARVAFLQDATGAEVSPSSRRGVLVPSAAVQASGADGVVYVLKGDVLEKRVVKLGPKSASEQTVASGVEPGERLAVGDFSKLADGRKVQLAAN